MLIKRLKIARLLSLPTIAMLMLVTPAQASYKNNCMLTGNIVSEVSSNEIPDQVVSKLYFQLAITAAEKFGRADSGCQPFINAKIDIELYQDPNHLTTARLIKGSQLKVIRFEGDVETTQANYKRLSGYQLF